MNKLEEQTRKNCEGDCDRLCDTSNSNATQGTEIAAAAAVSESNEFGRAGEGWGGDLLRVEVLEYDLC